jgi:hypothetical protein
MAEKDTYIKVVLGIGNSVRNRLRALPVGLAPEEVNVEGEIKFSNSDVVQFALTGVHPFVRTLIKVNDDAPVGYYGDQRIIPE